MALPPSLIAAPVAIPGPGIYQSGSSFENVVFWLLVAIAIIMGAGLVLYLFVVRGSYERERQAALALVGQGRRSAAPPPADRYRSASSYSYRGDVPEAVAEAMVGIGGHPEEEVVLVEEEPPARPVARRGAGSEWSRRPPAVAPPRPATFRSARPETQAAYARRAQPRYGAPSPLDDLLSPSGTEGLRDEDRELLREEQLEPEPRVPGLAEEDEEVTFEDEPEPAYHPPAPHRVSTRERPVWQNILEAPGAGRPAISKPVADELLRDSIMKSVKPGGPAWTEGRPVFSRPLEEPDVPRERVEPPESPVEDALGDISHRLHSMDRRAGPRLSPKAESKMGVQEKKFLEALRAVQEKKHEEERAREEAGARLLEEQMRDLERRKREGHARRAAEGSRQQQPRTPSGAGPDAQMRRWEQARRATQERMGPPDGRRPSEGAPRPGQPARPEAGRRQPSKPAPEEPSSVDEVLSRIGIK